MAERPSIISEVRMFSEHLVEVAKEFKEGLIKCTGSCSCSCQCSCMCQCSCQCSLAPDWMLIPGHIQKVKQP